MIKIILLLFIITHIYASEAQKKAVVFNMLIKNITNKQSPNVYLHTSIKEITLYPYDVNIVQNCKEADIVILSTVHKIPINCDEKIMFGTKYSHLKNKKVIGAFFWQKGRPNILFYKNRLEFKGIHLDSKFDKYIEN